MLINLEVVNITTSFFDVKTSQYKWNMVIYKKNIRSIGGATV